MKKTSKQHIIKWPIILFLILTLGLLIYGILFIELLPSSEKEGDYHSQAPQSEEGTISNEAFSKLIESNLSELGFVENISFSGKEDGYFGIQGTLKSPERLLALNTELQSLEVLLNALKGETITIDGHLGKNEIGNGCFITDTITFSGYTLPAGIGTEYIEKYTGLNQLLAVPFEEISFTKNGVSFENGLPEIIQIALYK